MEKYNKEKALKIAEELRGDGVDASIDQWGSVPGDQLPLFMEKAVRDSDYVLVYCTKLYKEKSDNRKGGVGYEGDLMTAEVLSASNRNKFIPIIDSTANWKEVAPSWLLGTQHIRIGSGYGVADLSNDSGYIELLDTLLGRRRTPPPIGVKTNKRIELASNLSEATNKLLDSPLDSSIGIAFIEHHLEDWIHSKPVKAFSMAVVDVDDLTQINRRYGEGVGDAVVAQLTDIFSLHAPQDAIWGRFGQDSFFFVFPNASLLNAKRLTDKILYGVSKFRWGRKICSDLWVTCSAGFASHDILEHSIETIIRAASGMKEAKSKGKNKSLESPSYISAPYRHYGDSENAQKKNPSLLADYLVRHYSY